MERHQVALCLAAIAVALVGGWLVPGSERLDVAIEPALVLLLFATFLGIPFRRLADGLRDRRFLAALALVNLVAAPVVAFALSRFVAADDALLVGVLLVLLAPCIDYVIVFAGAAGGSAAKLLSATPLLMAGQMLILPVCFTLFLGPRSLAMIDPAPFARAFLLMIALPLAAAGVVQLLAPRIRAVRAVERAGHAVMVPAMMLVLIAVIASQVRAIGGEIRSLWVVIPLFAAFAVAMSAAGACASRLLRLDAADGRAALFSGVTRNSLVVLPLALALPLPLAPLVVVTQTLVELVAMVLLVRLAPRILPARGADPRR
ncbi:arsenic resistance protein [Microbacterium sp. gxy059]